MCIYCAAGRHEGGDALCGRQHFRPRRIASAHRRYARACTCMCMLSRHVGVCAHSLSLRSMYVHAVALDGCTCTLERQIEVCAETTAASDAAAGCCSARTYVRASASRRCMCMLRERQADACACFRVASDAAAGCCSARAGAGGDDGAADCEQAPGVVAAGRAGACLACWLLQRPGV